ncbi:MAG: triose-phosphate isomerase [Deltaproteobacteria bacterium]|nr:triose-phosphate isomerase [Deltaproteobacteria bacterium]
MGTQRRCLIAGNWKMHTDRQGAEALARAVAEATASLTDVDVVVIPPACFLEAAGAALAGSAVALGAQNMHPEAKGAFTGEIAGPMLASLGVRYVLCGHSERRHVFGERASFVGDKVRAAHAHGLTPVLCVGETLEDRDAGRTQSVVAEQLDAGLAGLTGSQVRDTVIAYEPVWAIGTGRTASPEQAQEVHAFIRARIRDAHGADCARALRIQYGGSVKPDNAAELLGQPDIDGALVGGASLDAASFASIAAARPA